VVLKVDAHRHSRYQLLRRELSNKRSLRDSSDLCHTGNTTRRPAASPALRATGFALPPTLRPAGAASPADPECSAK
jgi:hypothetical protein